MAFVIIMMPDPASHQGPASFWRNVLLIRQYPSRTPLRVLPQALESRLKITLPEDLGEALSNGTILCQLVNQIRPRSVSIIHIPSPAVVRIINCNPVITSCQWLISFLSWEQRMLVDWIIPHQNSIFRRCFKSILDWVIEGVFLFCFVFLIKLQNVYVLI